MCCTPANFLNAGRQLSNGLYRELISLTSGNKRFTMELIFRSVPPPPTLVLSLANDGVEITRRNCSLHASFVVNWSWLIRRFRCHRKREVFSRLLVISRCVGQKRIESTEFIVIGNCTSAVMSELSQWQSCWDNWRGAHFYSAWAIRLECSTVSFSIWLLSYYSVCRHKKQCLQW